jgi:hypothetical protein
MQTAKVLVHSLGKSMDIFPAVSKMQYKVMTHPPEYVTPKMICTAESCQSLSCSYLSLTVITNYRYTAETSINMADHGVALLKKKTAEMSVTIIRTNEVHKQKQS